MPVENSHPGQWPASNVMRVMPPPVAGAISAAMLHVPGNAPARETALKSVSVLRIPAGFDGMGT